jgi:hypothetical protein
MVLIGDVCQVEAHFGPFGDSVNQGLRQTYHSIRNHFDAPNATPR